MRGSIRAGVNSCNDKRSTGRGSTPCGQVNPSSVTRGTHPYLPGEGHASETLVVRREGICTYGLRKQEVTQTEKHTLVNTGREHTGAPGSIFATYLEIQTLSRLKSPLECPVLSVT